MQIEITHEVICLAGWWITYRLIAHRLGFAAPMRPTGGDWWSGIGDGIDALLRAFFCLLTLIPWLVCYFVFR